MHHEVIIKGFDDFGDEVINTRSQLCSLLGMVEVIESIRANWPSIVRITVDIALTSQQGV
jgi:hypothetical protein